MDPRDQEVSETKPRFRLADAASKALKSVDEFVSAPGGYENPPGKIVSEVLGIPAAARTLDRLAYGDRLTEGSGQTLHLKEDTIQSLPFVPPLAKGAAKSTRLVPLALDEITSVPRIAGQRGAVDYGALGDTMTAWKKKLSSRDDILKDDRGDAVILFRGTNSPEAHDPGAGIKGRAAFATDNPHKASTYVYEPFDSSTQGTGAVFPMTLRSGVEVIEFPVKDGRFDKFAFDQAAERLKPNQVLVARSSHDIGPASWNDAYQRSTFRSDVYAFKDPSVVKPLYTKENAGVLDVTDSGWKQKQREITEHNIAVYERGLKSHPENEKRGYDLVTPAGERHTWEPYRGGAEAELARLKKKLQKMNEDK